MSFQAYLDNIEIKTGKSPSDFKEMAAEKGLMENGLLNPKVKAGEVISWLKEEFDLGHGHSMAIVAFLKGKKE
nr:DUF4287 domain-containing protein [Pedobacter sp. ASV19]